MLIDILVVFGLHKQGLWTFLEKVTNQTNFFQYIQLIFIMV